MSSRSNDIVVLAKVQVTQPKERVHVVSHESHPRWSRITEPTELSVDPFREKVEGFVNERYNYYVNEVITRYLDLVWHDKREKKKERKGAKTAERTGEEKERIRGERRKKKWPTIYYYLSFVNG